MFGANTVTCTEVVCYQMLTVRVLETFKLSNGQCYKKITVLNNKWDAGAT
jgi:hypothetical protein